MTKLKKCPNVLCGKDECEVESYPKYLSGTRYYVQCPYCEVQGKAYETPEEAIEYWNDRPERDFDKLIRDLEFYMQSVQGRKADVNIIETIGKIIRGEMEVIIKEHNEDFDVIVREVEK